MRIFCYGRTDGGKYIGPEGGSKNYRTNDKDNIDKTQVTKTDGKHRKRGKGGQSQSGRYVYQFQK